MDYEKKYNEALEWMREMYPCLTDSLREDAEHYFPELRESEDERIRTRLSEYFRGFLEGNEHCYEDGGYVKWEGLDVKSILDWLEKQKEQKPWKVGENAYFTPEQKPAEWSEEDEKILNRIIETLSLPPIYDTKACAKMVSWLKSLHPQPKQEWSEEDIKKIRSEEYTKGFNDAAFGGKLKEWSAEDEDRIRQIERIAQQAGCTQKLQEEIHDWLKSLRPHWKPSEEQMEAPRNVPPIEGVRKLF